ncbi:interleukin-17 receptor E-like [Megalops cyprinoides]|uniref:interleukin-17 receptor E-like n=1 Tax=Megalops cyprinoides TaxID=118141 RepID=UPI0018648773|nr:interleukin-17 receptor E-like [Megalops cyprinoides]
MQSFLLLVLTACGALTQENQIERIQECGGQCSQGLQCRNRLHSPFAPCKTQPKRLQGAVIHGMSVATVMRCERRQKCSLHLRVASSVQISEHIQGVSMCTVSAGMLERCVLTSFPRAAQAQQVEVQNDCFNVSPGQDVHVTVNTVPNYCNVTRSQRYRVQGCYNDDLRNNLPECITGKIAYSVDPERRELSVSVTDMLEDRDYHLRLCHRWHTCTGTGAYTLIKREDRFKNVTFPFVRPLPCLCIEGWSSMVDAPRIQVYPFRNRTEELWMGVTFDPEEEALSWELACPMEVVTTLCHKVGEDSCLDLVNSSQSAHKRKVTYSKVDSNPQLCIKFTTKARSWIKCPFADGNFPAWHLTVSSDAGQLQATLTSRIRSELSLRLCKNSHPSACNDVISVPMEKANSLSINLTVDMCKADACIQVRRVDARFTIPLLMCHFQCPKVQPVEVRGQRWEMEWMLVLAVACLTVVMAAALVGNIVLLVCYRRRVGACPFQRSTDPRPAGVTLLRTTDDEGHAHLARDLEKLLLGLGMSVKLADLDEKADGEQALCSDLVVLLWSKGCGRHLDRLAVGGCRAAPAQREHATPAPVRVDIVTYDGLTVAPDEVPAWLNAVPLKQLEVFFTDTHYAGQPPLPTWHLFPGQRHHGHFQTPIQAAPESDSSEKSNLLCDFLVEAKAES